MRELKYDMIDPVSGLIIKPMTDNIVRKIADMEGIHPSEVLERSWEALNEVGLRYAVNPEGILSPVSKNVIIKNASTYFDEYKDAFEASQAILVQAAQKNNPDGY